MQDGILSGKTKDTFAWDGVCGSGRDSNYMGLFIRELRALAFEAAESTVYLQLGMYSFSSLVLFVERKHLA